MSDCIVPNWGKMNSDGYLRAPNGQAAHRWAWEQSNGQIAKGLHVLHKCDNPPCINVDHLFLGTPKDNARDMCAKGRHVDTKGVNNGRAVLTEFEVKEMRRLVREEGWTITAAGREFDQGQNVASNIINRRTWAHLGD